MLALKVTLSEFYRGRAKESCLKNIFSTLRQKKFKITELDSPETRRTVCVRGYQWGIMLLIINNVVNNNNVMMLCYMLCYIILYHIFIL